jgi:hypothetical protein
MRLPRRKIEQLTRNLMSDITLAALASGAKSDVVLTPELERMGSSLPKVHV